MSDRELPWAVIAGTVVGVAGVLWIWWRTRASRGRGPIRTVHVVVFAGMLVMAVVGAALAQRWVDDHRQRQAKLDAIDAITEAAIAVVEEVRRDLPAEWSIERVIDYRSLNRRSARFDRGDAGPTLDRLLERGEVVGLDLAASQEHRGRSFHLPIPKETVSRQRAISMASDYRALDAAIAAKRHALGREPQRLALDGEPPVALLWPLAFPGDFGSAWSEWTVDQAARAISPRQSGVVLLRLARDGRGADVVRVAWTGEVTGPVALVVPPGEHIWELVVRQDGEVCGVMSRDAARPPPSAFLRCFDRDGVAGEKASRTLPKGLEPVGRREVDYFWAAADGIAFKSKDGYGVIGVDGAITMRTSHPPSLQDSWNGERIQVPQGRIDLGWSRGSIVMERHSVTTRVVEWGTSAAFAVSDDAGRIAVLLLDAEGTARLVISSDGGGTWVGRAQPAPGDEPANE